MNLKGRILFYGNLRTMIVAGIDYSQVLQLLSSQKLDPSTKEAVDTLKDGIKRGKTIFETVCANRQHFPEIDREMLGIGERSGTLDNALKLLVDYLESQRKYRNQLIGAMLYPFGALHVFVLINPALSLLFLPGYAWGQFLFALAGLVLFVDIIPAILWKVIQIKSVNDVVMDILIKVPIMLKLDITKYILGLQSMHAAGLDITESMKVSSRLCTSRTVRKTCLSMAYMVKKGRTLAESFSSSPLFPPMVVNMISTGEYSGTIDSMLKKLAEYYTDELNRTISMFVKVFPKVMYGLAMIYMGSMIVKQFKAYLSSFDLFG